jgi:hypothetical protein
VSLRGKVDLPPDEVFDILVDEDNHKVFKAIKARARCPRPAAPPAGVALAGKPPSAGGRGRRLWPSGRS